MRQGTAIESQQETNALQGSVDLGIDVIDGGSYKIARDLGDQVLELLRVSSTIARGVAGDALALLDVAPLVEVAPAEGS